LHQGFAGAEEEGGDHSAFGLPAPHERAGYPSGQAEEANSMRINDRVEVNRYRQLGDARLVEPAYPNGNMKVRVQ